VLQGIDGWIVDPEPGEHRSVFTVRGRGGEAEVEVVLRTVQATEGDQGWSGPSGLRAPAPRRGEEKGDGAGDRDVSGRVPRSLLLNRDPTFLEDMAEPVD